MTTLRIAVTGGNGVMGRALCAYLPDAVYLTRHNCDVRNERQARAALRLARPDVVIHAAALTDHAHPNAADIIETNVIGTQHVAEACRELGARLVYLSTHYVYEGAIGDYREDAVPKPIGAYAMSKLAGEYATQRAHDTLVVRGSWYTYETRLKHWLARGVIADAWVSRESASDAARKIARLALSNALGTFNIGRPRRTFRHIIEDECPNEKYVIAKRINAGTPYAFPADVSVNTDKFDAWEAQHE